MKYFRITIAELSLVVLVTAIGLAAIRGNSPAWAGALLSITFFALICSFLAIGLGRGPRRIYWLGFAVLGWSYLFLMCVPWLQERFGAFLLAPNLFPYLEELLQNNATPGGQGLQSLPVGSLGPSAMGGAFGRNAGFAGYSDSDRIGVALEALLWAFLGGWVARYFASGRDGSGAPEGAPPPIPRTPADKATTQAVFDPLVW